MNKTFIRFVIGGIISYGVKIAATFVATEVFRLWYFYSYLFSLALVIVVNYLVNVYYIFRVQDHLLMNFVKYLGSILLFYLADAALVKALTDWLLLNYLVSIVISTTLFFLGKFVFYQFFLFKGKDKTSHTASERPPSAEAGCRFW